MEAIGDEVSNKIRSAIKAKFKEIGLHVDEELPDYVMVMVANKRSKEQMEEDLQLFLGKHTSLFTTWLHQVLQKLQEVTVAKLDDQTQASLTTNSAVNVEELIGIVLYENRPIGGAKRKSLDEHKKKKKSKQDMEKKEIKKKVKEEPEDKEQTLKDKDSRKESKDNSESENDKEIHEAKSNKKQKLSRLSPDVTKDATSDPKNKKSKEDSSDSSHDEHQRKSGVSSGGRGKTLSVSSHAEDLDDEDCINIRTDGELLDTAEDVNVEESSKKTKEKEDLNSKSKVDKNNEKLTIRHSPERNKEKSRTLYHNGVDRVNSKERLSPVRKRSPSPQKINPISDDKVIDARELLNRKKAAKQADNKKRSRSRSREKDRSLSPVRKRREEERERSYREERGRRSREEEKEISSRKHSREEERDRRALRDRESHSSKRRDEWPRKLESDRLERSKERRRESSAEPPPKRVMLDRSYKDKNDDWGSSRRAKSSEGRKGGAESPKKKDAEDGARRPGLVSRVVARVTEPEEEVEAPTGVPSVVKVTPRPRRPPSQQPSTSLIMRAISEANKSLANVPQRPDSTQRGRKEPGVFSRPLRQLKRIPPEKIAVEIKNPLAVLSEPIEGKDEDAGSVSPIPKDKSGRNMSPPSDHFNMEATPSEPDVTTTNIIRGKSVIEEQIEENPERSQPEMEAEDEIELEPSQDLETCDEQMDEASEPQFVVTLNGYDPDGIFSQSELDDDEEPLLTSTPDEVESPRPKREVDSSPNVIVGAPAVNHNNLIEVEILRTKSERCKYWPACRLGDKCTYYHPSKPCKVFPNCKFGDACLYIHPQCKFNALCTRKDCVFAHTNAHTPVQPTVVTPKTKALYAASAPPCKFYPNCTNIHCQFSHPPRACRFGLYCTKKDCSFDHGQIAPVDKLKWTRVPPS